MHIAGGWGRVAIVIAALGCSGFSSAATIEDAQRIVDRAEPLRCEARALEAVLRLTLEGSEEHAKLAAAVAQARARLKEHYRATMWEYIDVMKQLPFEERKKVYAYSAAVAERCAGKQKLKERETGLKGGLSAI